MQLPNEIWYIIWGYHRKNMRLLAAKKNEEITFKIKKMKGLFCDLKTIIPPQIYMGWYWSRGIWSRRGRRRHTRWLLTWENSLGILYLGWKSDEPNYMFLKVWSKYDASYIVK